jgi:hypothetical protein
MKQLKIFLAFGLMFILVYACKKNEFLSTVNEVILSQQETQSDEILADVDLMVDEALQVNQGQLKSGTIGSAFYLSDCAVVTKNITSTPQVITIDFGASCTGKDGKIRSGKIMVTSDSFTTSSADRKKIFENYTVDGKKIVGSVVKTIIKDNENKIRTATLQEDITVTLPNNEGTAHRVANLTRQYQLNDLGVQDDNQVVSWGTAEFTRVSGVKLTKTITAADPLVFNAACHHIVSGTVTFTTSNNHGWSVNFGNGECDNKATLTIGNKTKEITIR